ncbi:hypothetical protein [Zhongshania arctica]|uniref:Uncharacterized protein n=1 Tax=Zhongshania arctica TaxID=3238302 RepID=A0ABV3TZA2_9GAMM
MSRIQQLKMAFLDMYLRPLAATLSDTMLALLNRLKIFFALGDCLWRHGV